jgi:hypothetical protein
MLTKEQFIRLYENAHRRVTGRVPLRRLAESNFNRYVELAEFTGTDDGTPVFRPLAGQAPIDRDGELVWYFRPPRIPRKQPRDRDVR